MPMSQTVQGRYIIVPTPENMIFDIVDAQCNAVQTWGNKTKCKTVVEDVDVHFCRKNLFGELDLCDKDKEAKNDRNDYSKH